METATDIINAHRAGRSTPAETVARCYARIRAHGDRAIFITLRDEADAIAEAKALATKDKSLPLYGVPVAIKDNIDVAGLPTTAACPAFSYMPKEDAAAVAKLRAAGAIVIGKTNLDQFATGLVGMRSPYGVPKNALDPKLIPGGSSSGSAVAVAAGLMPLALGTDTAGSGRVPAMLNNIVGLKPSLGLISTFGVVPACRSLDCVSVFALTVDEAWTALNVMAGYDERDPYSRKRLAGPLPATPPHARIGILRDDQREFFGDAQAARGYDEALARLEKLGATLIEIDAAPLFETARLLYEGPWVAERCVAARELLAKSPGEIHSVTRGIIEKGLNVSALQTFEALYELNGLRQKADAIFAGIDMLAVPTAPTSYTVEQLEKEPVLFNSRLGTYTNFVNLLDLCGLAIPAALEGKRGFGITLLAPGGEDARLAALGRVFHADTKLPLGASQTPQPALQAGAAEAVSNEIVLAVVGAHMSGLPLNKELTNLGSRFLRAAATSSAYKLFALPGGPPQRPGMLRVAGGQGHAIDLELWALPAEGFGRFVAAVPPPLSIGSVALGDGTTVKGFLVEAEGAAGARDISEFGGWRAFLAAT